MKKTLKRAAWINGQRYAAGAQIEISDAEYDAIISTPEGKALFVDTDTTNETATVKAKETDGKHTESAIRPS